MDEDRKVVVHRPEREDVTMPFSQWLENQKTYEEAGFTFDHVILQRKNATIQ